MAEKERIKTVSLGRFGQQVGRCNLPALGSLTVWTYCAVALTSASADESGYYKPEPIISTTHGITHN
jgi:hypothetical protein